MCREAAQNGGLLPWAALKKQPVHAKVAVREHGYGALDAYLPSLRRPIRFGIRHAASLSSDP
jgi:hypothetical protein